MNHSGKRRIATSRTRPVLFVLLVGLGAWWLPVAGSAHEITPAYLAVRETRPGEFNVMWKTPPLGEPDLPIEPTFSGATERISAVVTRTTPGTVTRTWTLRAPALRGQAVRLDMPDNIVMDALVRFAFADGTTWTQRLTSQQPSAIIPARQTAWSVAGVYAKLGIEHILFGMDHLLFVLGLLLVVHDRWMLVKTVTAFTVAHSITLAIATFGYASAPAPPLNAAIALSILFLGLEIVRMWRGKSSITIRKPWVVAFCFGLLHGFGFASALTSAGLPRADLPQALLTFNVGVELGQVAFVGLVLALERSFRQLEIRWTGWVLRAPGYAIGSFGAFWTIQRTVMMFQ
jgi:hydrogenase/urease accessory protein HupE